jgi:hypothetical protein
MLETYDTETIDGKAFLLSSSRECIEVKSFDDCMDFLFKSDARLTFAYNMDYDASAILKYLPPRDIDKLYLHTSININGMRIVYLPAKVFRITRQGSAIEMFDLLQFYNMSLENASQKYLGEGKDDIPHEVKTDMGKYYPLPEWHDKIKFYCLRDAKLTYRLAEHFLSMLQVAGVEARKYYSTGYLAGKYLDKVKPGKLPEDISNFIAPSYYGGRNECTMRGTIPKVFIYDITSAYPSVIRNLQSLDGATYREGKKIDPKSTYQIIKGKFWMVPNRFIYPIPWKEKKRGFIYYPQFTGQTATITGQEWEVLERHNLISKVKNMEVLNIYCLPGKPFSFVDELYQERKKSDAHSYIFKLILNSLYGKFYEKRKSVVSMNPREMAQVDYAGAHELEFRKYWEYAKLNCSNAYKFYEKKCSCRFCVATWHLSRATRWQRKKKIDPIIVTTDSGDLHYFRTLEKGGRRFNVLYASLITASIRSLIYDAAVTVGKDFIACFTDSIFSLSPIDDKYIGEDIGKFSMKGIGKNFAMIGSGVYEYDGFDKEGNEKTFTRFRGFSRSGGLRDILNVPDCDIELSSLQRITWGTIVQQTKTWNPSDFNKLIERQRKLHINFDHKREWEMDFSSGSDILSKRITSKSRIL